MTDTTPPPTTELSIPGEWALKKLLGPVFDEIGPDLASLYKVGRDKVISVATRKSDLNDGNRANLRVTRDVFWNGSFTNEPICAEYFGGILAASRSPDGKDDRGVYYADIIKSLSSQQLLLHYVIYFAINKLWLRMPSEKSRPNVGFGTDLQNYQIWFATNELESFGISVEKDVIALANKGLIGNGYEAKDHKFEDNKILPYTKVMPSTIGIQLYAVAHNKLATWRDLPFQDFGNFPEITVPQHFFFSLEEMLTQLNLKSA